MDPLSAIGLASNIISFVDFASKLVSQGYEIYKSGALQDNVDLDVVVTDLSLHVNKLKQANSITAPTLIEQQLKGLAARCAVLADEISKELDKLKFDPHARFKTLISIKKAVKTAWRKKDYDEKSVRLRTFRDELQFGILASLKDNFDLASIQISERFDRLDEQGQNVFAQELSAQTTVITNLHKTTETNIKQHIDQYEAPRQQEKSDKQIQNDREIEDIILQHLGFSSLERRYVAILPAHAKTFDWIFDPSSSSGFSDWLEGKNNQNLFWINGKAGSGKSTLMKYIYEDPRTKEKLSQWAGGRIPTMASFFFWINGDADQCSQTGLLRSLLHHLILQHRHLIRHVFPNLWETLKTSRSSFVWRTWSLSDVSKALVNLLRRDLGKVVLFIDGLDEYHGDHNNHLSPDRPEYYTEIVNLIHSISSPEVKICFSSRPLLIFHNNFDRWPKLRVQDLTKRDIYTYAQDKLVNDPVVAALRSEQAWEPSIILWLIIDQAEGVFLWVVLVVASLLTGIHKFDAIEELEARLELIPSNFMDLYRHMLKQIEPVHLAEGCEIFAIADAALVVDQEKWRHYYRRNILGDHSEKLCMLGLWFALEHSKVNNFGATNLQSLSTNAEIIKAITVIDRKLKTRCAGILEARDIMPIEDPMGDPYEYWADAPRGIGNILMNVEFGNRRLQYLHRTAKELLDLQETKLFLNNSLTLEFDPKVSLLWSAIQRIRIYEVEIYRPTRKTYPSDRLLRLADSALLMANCIQNEGKKCPVELLNLLNSTMQRETSPEKPLWVTEALYPLYGYDSRYLRPRNETSIGTSEPYEYRIEYLDPRFNDDFLSLAIVYGLGDYVEFELLKCPSVVRQKSGRPYLDYALACIDQKLIDGIPRIIQMLLKLGVDPDGYCPTSYSLAEWEEGHKEREINFGYTTWTPWQSALDSILNISIREYGLKLNPKQLKDWIEVFRYLLAKGPDVSVKTWTAFWDDLEHKPYTVSETITAAFAQRFPPETAELLATVEKLARAQGVLDELYTIN